MVSCTIQGKKGIKRQAGQQATLRGERLGRSIRILELNFSHKEPSTHKLAERSYSSQSLHPQYLSKELYWCIISCKIWSAENSQKSGDTIPISTFDSNLHAEHDDNISGSFSFTRGRTINGYAIFIILISTEHIKDTSLVSEVLFKLLKSYWFSL